MVLVGGVLNMGNGILLGSMRLTDVCLLHGALAGSISKELFRGRYARMRIVEPTHQFLDGQRKVDPQVFHTLIATSTRHQGKEKQTKTLTFSFAARISFSFPLEISPGTSPSAILDFILLTGGPVTSFTQHRIF
jgi:hypothetical protein